MADDNTLGAPTEGLGQTVTFGFKTSDKGASQGVQRGRIRAGVSGQSGVAGINQATGVKVEESPAVAMLMKVGQSLIDQDIKKARTAAYVGGMQRAMNGEAVDDIAAKQPAWSRVFGDSDAVEGARAYSAERKVQDTLLSIENDMPNLRRMGPKEANDFYVQSVNSALTGDPATDNAVMSAVQRNLPGVIKRQTQMHYAYLQENAAEEEAGALASAAERLQAAGVAVSKGEMSPEDFEERMASVSMLSVPAQGRDPKFVREQRASSAVLMAEQGQFHALNAMEKIGMFDLLLPAQKAAVVRSRQANELQWKSKYGQEYSDRVAAIKNLAERPTGGWRAEDTMAVVQEINAEYKARTGSQSDYFNPDIVAAYGERTAQAIAAMQKAQLADMDRAKTEALKANDTKLAMQITEGAISQAAAMGTLSTVVGMGYAKDNEVDGWFVPRALQVFTSALTAKEEDFGFIARNGAGGYVNKMVADQLGLLVNGAVSNGAASNTFAAVYEGWRKLNAQSPEAAAAYYRGNHAKFQRFSLGHPAGVDVKNPSDYLAAAFNGSFGPNAERFGAKVDKAEFTAAVKQIGNDANSWLPEQLGGDKRLRPGVAEFIANQTMHRAEVLGASGSLVDGFKAARAVAGQDNLRVVGGYAWLDGKSKDFVGELQAIVGKDKFSFSSNLEVSNDFGDFVDAEVAKVGGMDRVNIERRPDALMLIGYKDGQPRRHLLEMNRIAEHIMTVQKNRRNPSAVTTTNYRPKAPDLQLGPMPSSMRNK